MASDLHEKANFIRLSRLLVDKGTEALRTTLDTIHPPANLPAVLNANQSTLSKLKHRVINDFQWDLLFPPPGNSPDSKKFDVTLLTILLRNICGLHPPATGWNTMPPDTDNLIQANITRIKLFRNQVYAHVTSTQVDQTTFDKLWQKISQALFHLSIPQTDIDYLKICPLGPDEEIYVKILKEWALSDYDCKTMLAEVQQHQRDDRENFDSSMKNLAQLTAETHRGVHQLCSSRENQRQTLNFEQTQALQKLAKHNFKSKIRRKVKLFHRGTRDWLLKKVGHWFTTEEESRLFLITAGPGFGKSVLAAKICEVFREKGKLAACHFCDFSNSNLNDPMLMLQSLASHMCENITGFKEELDDQLSRPHKVHSLNDAFQIYLQNPLDELEFEPSLIVIDGLDESATEDKSEIVKLIADYFPELPKCVKVLITSRPGLFLQRLKDVQKIEIAEAANENNSDLLQYLEFFLPSLSTRETLNQPAQSRHSVDSSEGNEDDEDSLQYITVSRFSNTDTVLQEIVEKCEGSFLYAFHVQRELSKRENVRTMSFKEIMAYLPEGIGSIYQEYFHRLEMELEAVMRKKPDLFKLLEMLVASPDPLPLNFVARAFALDSDCREVKKVISKVNEAVSCLLYVSHESVTVFHKSVCDWLLAEGNQEHEYTVKDSDGKKQLWLLCEQIFKEIKTEAMLSKDIMIKNEVTYALEHGHCYLIECNMEDSFYWLVDIIILYYLSRVDFQSYYRLQFLLRNVLQRDVAISPRLRQQLSWHFVEISNQMIQVFRYDLKLLKSCTRYLESVLAYSPEGCFTEKEKRIAEDLLKKDDHILKRNLTVATPIKSLIVEVFQIPIVAIGISSSKKLAAVALKSGVICVLSLPDLAKLWQCSTEYESISCCTFAPDDSILLFGILQTALDIAERKKVVFFKEREEVFESCAFSPNGMRLVTVHASNTLKVWDVVKQSVTAVLDAGTHVDCCSFTNAGLFITADEKNSSADSYCMWNAISFQRVDLRRLSVSKFKHRFLKSKKCLRCFQQAIKELIPPTKLEIAMATSKQFVSDDQFAMSLPSDLGKEYSKESTGTYRGLTCIFCFNDHSLRIIENVHFTTLATWEIYIKPPPSNALPITRRPILDITAIEDDIWLYGDDDKLALFSTLPPIKDQSYQSCLTRTLWCCFSPDDTRLATCSSDGFVNLWNVDTCHVYQRFKTNAETLAVACWWSDNYLFIFNVIDKRPSLSKYPVRDNFKVIITQKIPVPVDGVVSEFLQFSRIIHFSEGFLSFECGTAVPIKLLHVNRIEHPKVIPLPGGRPMMRVAVSGGASFVLGVAASNGGECILWKRTDAQSVMFEMFLYFPLSDVLQFSEPVMFESCFSNDSKFAVATFVTNEGRHVFVTDVNTGVTTPFSMQMKDKSLPLPKTLKVFCTNKVIVFLTSKLVEVIDFKTWMRHGISLQRSLSEDLLIHSKLSPKRDILAYPVVTGDIVFFELKIQESCLIPYSQDALLSDPKSLFRWFATMAEVFIS